MPQLPPLLERLLQRRRLVNAAAIKAVGHVLAHVERGGAKLGDGRVQIDAALRAAAKRAERELARRGHRRQRRAQQRAPDGGVERRLLAPHDAAAGAGSGGRRRLGHCFRFERTQNTAVLCTAGQNQNVYS